ncbi:MAG: lytic transglycosylase domain-containing protein [Roseovarius sp.]|nr:lytic transglycosylase domain-containing protein [Roseovarius sp.]
MILRRIALVAALGALAACGTAPREPQISTRALPLYPGETPEIRQLINDTADRYEVPRALVHKVVQRESDYRPGARNGPYYGMMQILPATARGIGFRGDAAQLLDAETNLNWGVKYLRGAWLVSDGDMDRAVMWYARGYYYEARDRCLLVETGLLDREVARHCRA